LLLFCLEGIILNKLWQIPLLLIVTACSTPRSTAKLDFTYHLSSINGKYEVKQNDSLHAIAHKFDKKVKYLARLNELNYPYTIHPGQVIKLRGHPLALVENRAQIAPKYKKLITKRTLKPNVEPVKVTTNKQEATKRVAKSWLWPASGNVINNFYAGPSKDRGVDIAGGLNSPIVATADGVVAYSGDDIRGYGNLIIIKHKNNYLSAYAHNKKNLVREGDSIKRGQKIALMGKTGADTVKLHFELRLEGKPQDPLLLLSHKK